MILILQTNTCLSGPIVIAQGPFARASGFCEEAMCTLSIVAYASLMAHFKPQSSRHNASKVETICANVANLCGNGFNNIRGLDGETAGKRPSRSLWKLVLDAEAYTSTCGAVDHANKYS